MSCLVEYNEQGKIISSLTGPEKFLLTAAQEMTNSYLIEDESYTDATHYVKNAKIVAKGNQPSEAHVFNFAAGLWELDLAIAKDLKWAEIKSARAFEEFGTFDWGGYTFQCDEVSQRRIQGAVQLAAIDNTMTLDWTLADNSVQNFTAAEYVQIGQALAIHVSGCHERGRIRRSEIDAATTAEELEAIVW